MIVRGNWMTWGNFIKIVLIAFVLGFIVSQIDWSPLPIYGDLIILYVG